MIEKMVWIFLMVCELLQLEYFPFGLPIKNFEDFEFCHRDQRLSFHWGNFLDKKYIKMVSNT